MVASDSRLASQAGARVLAAGGNAADAACATALALGVVDPFASGLGGGGFALIYSAKTGKVEALDFRETAPAALRPDLFMRAGRIDRALSVRGGLAVGVPGEPSGLAELVRRWGKRRFARCVEPAEALARGFPASAWLVDHVADELKQSPDAASFLAQVLARKRGPLAQLRAGDLVRRPELARTLARLRREGAAAFYRGEIADAIVTAVRDAGGVLERNDLAGYAAIERAPLLTTFRGRRIFAFPPPSAGGVIMFEVLGILSERTTSWNPVPGGAQDPAYLHLLVEALKHGFADRSRFLGDPAFVNVPLSHLLDSSYHRELLARIQPGGTLAPERYGTTPSLAAARPATRGPPTSPWWTAKATPSRSRRPSTWNSARTFWPAARVCCSIMRWTISRWRLAFPTRSGWWLATPTCSRRASGRSRPCRPPLLLAKTAWKWSWARRAAR